MTVLHGLLCINSAVACVAHTPIQMSRRSPIKASPACLAVKKEGKKKGSVSIHLMNLYPLRWVHSLLQWNSVLITEQEGDEWGGSCEDTDIEIAEMETDL